MDRIEHLITSLAWACVGALLGLLAGFTAGYRRADLDDDPVINVVVHRWVDSMRDAARTN